MKKLGASQAARATAAATKLVICESGRGLTSGVNVCPKQTWPFAEFRFRGRFRVKRTCRFALHMSAFDPKRTSLAAAHMSAFGGKDIP